jgi:hypothetical protein
MRMTSGNTLQLFPLLPNLSCPHRAPADLPKPVERLAKQGAAQRPGDLSIKRDDLTASLVGGNKAKALAGAVSASRKLGLGSRPDPFWQTQGSGDLDGVARAVPQSAVPPAFAGSFTSPVQELDPGQPILRPRRSRST